MNKDASVERCWGDCSDDSKFTKQCLQKTVVLSQRAKCRASWCETCDKVAEETAEKAHNELFVELNNEFPHLIIGPTNCQTLPDGKCRFLQKPLRSGCAKPASAFKRGPATSNVPRIESFNWTREEGPKEVLENAGAAVGHGGARRNRRSANNRR